jgi:hypothetical protein
MWRNVAGQQSEQRLPVGADRRTDSAGRTVTACEPDSAKGPVYEIDVRGHVGEIMRQAFPGLDAGWRGPDTRFRGRLPDQAALYGVLAQLEALGLELLEVHRLPQ